MTDFAKLKRFIISHSVMSPRKSEIWKVRKSDYPSVCPSVRRSAASACPRILNVTHVRTHHHALPSVIPTVRAERQCKAERTPPPSSLCAFLPLPARGRELALLGTTPPACPPLHQNLSTRRRHHYCCLGLRNAL